jgi:hypothetical protein
MSGGSFDYLYCHLNPEDLGECLLDLRRMEAALEETEDDEGIPAGRHAARAVRDVLRLIRGASDLAMTLENVFHEVEWWKSGDGNKERALEALAAFGRYEPGKGPP